MLLNSHISAYATCFARRVCGLMRSTWGTFLGEDKLGARDRILNTKVAHQACAGLAPGKHSPFEASNEITPGCSLYYITHLYKFATQPANGCGG